jgi:hypothetical protein
MPAIDTKIPVRFLDFSKFFFDIVTASLTQTIKHGNHNIIMCKPTANPEHLYDKATTWSDFRIIVPILFNFFHGIELWLKGAHYLKAAPTNKANHKLTILLELFKSEYPDNVILHAILSDYILPTHNCPILQTFYQTNAIQNSDQFYEMLKYPYDKSHQTSFNYKDIRNLTDSGIPFFEKIISDIATIEAETPKL